MKLQLTEKILSNCGTKMEGTFRFAPCVANDVYLISRLLLSFVSMIASQLAMAKLKKKSMRTAFGDEEITKIQH